MVKSCIALYCKNKFDKLKNIHFHKFPLKNKDLCLKWVASTKRENYIPSNYAFICSEHFLLSDYVFSPHDLKPRLKQNAVPSIFKFPAKQQPKKQPKKLPAKEPPPEDEPHNQLSTSNASFSVTNILSSHTPKKQKPPAKRTLPEDEPHSQPSTSYASFSVTNATAPPSKKQKVVDSPIKSKLKRKIKTLQQKLRRKEKKISSMKEMMSELQDKKLLTEDCANVLENNFSGMTREFLISELNNHEKRTRGKRYSDELKKFALTLHFYSPRAYNFMRSTFSLPAPSSIANWTSSVNCEPGFFSDVFEYLEEKSQTDSTYKDCALMFDGVHIKSGLHYNSSMGKYEGFMNFGDNVVAFDEDKVATEALVFMLVGIQGHWKCPVGYVLCNSITASNLNTLITNCLQLSFQHNLFVHSVTCDGTKGNFDSLKSLDVNLVINLMI